MDWGTHVVLASKLLEAAGLEREAAIYSDLPVIDVKHVIGGASVVLTSAGIRDALHKVTDAITSVQP